MLNQERSKIMAKSHNFGIAEALVGQFTTKKRTSEFSFNKDKQD
jgi:Rod binding domain-containing protein